MLFLVGKYTLEMFNLLHLHVCGGYLKFTYLRGHKSTSIFCKFIPIHLLTTRLPTLKHSATVAREARVKAQEVGVISLVRFSHGDTGSGYLVVGCPKIFLQSLFLITL